MNNHSYENEKIFISMVVYQALIKRLTETRIMTTSTLICQEECCLIPYFDCMTKPWGHTVNTQVRILHKTHSLHKDDSLQRGTTEESPLIFKETLSESMFYGHY